MDADVVEIDGSQGEGGGQILRSSLALSVATRRPVRIVKIRARRTRPGLLRQHLTAVSAAREISQAEVSGEELGSTELMFAPQSVSPGDYSWSIGSSGSTTLVLQTVLPVLLTADGPSTLTIEGGTHNPFAPPFEYLALTLIPLLNRLGARVRLDLVRPGFHPGGGGKLRVSIAPAAHLERLSLTERGKMIDVRARAIVSNLPLHIAERELNVIGRKLRLRGEKLTAEELKDGRGPGNVLLVEMQSADVTEVVTGFGEQGVPAERVAARVARECRKYLDSGAPVGEHLADQLLVPLALGSGGEYVTHELSSHAETNIEVVRRFLETAIAVVEQGDAQTLIRIG
ncbi:MAG: RNA 3'-terminal phosphate cyclase [Planctomycetota bacterium]|nr:MAG: RNA 3'-terminal phosphate cyclase [Planctomycetota bacterium]REK25544.1 MAG: RNA 3'-terminal phosphate cyclase [Planctomycetota bacterium]REK31744.1 MAG: RNA 3'-terminal phosphate cyclase [Planctomycetota bacterium]